MKFFEPDSLDRLKELGFDPPEKPQESFWEPLRPALYKFSPKEWERIAVGLDNQSLRLLADLLDENAENAIEHIGQENYDYIRIECVAWQEATRAGPGHGRWYDIDKLRGLLHLVELQEEYEASRGSGSHRPPPSYRELGRTIGVSDKTAKQWHERLRAAGPAPEGIDRVAYLLDVMHPGWEAKTVPP